MTILLSHTAALAALRNPAMRRRLSSRDRCEAMVPDRAPTRLEAAAVLEAIPGISAPVDCLVEASANRRHNELFRAHASCATLPADSAVRVSDDVLCTSPEQLLVQMAPTLTTLELVFLLGEVLGTYAISPEHPDGMFERSVPLTSKELILQHLDRLGPVPGSAKVRTALALACENAASPYETRLSMRLGLKPSLGGYHLNVLSMNQPLEVRRINALLGVGIRKPDVYLGSTRPDSPFSGVAFDYHGKVHEKPRSITADLERQNELLGIDFKVYTLNKALYDDIEYMDGIVRLVRRDLGLGREHVGAREASRRRVLRQGLHDELERIDGVRWEGQLREAERKRRAARPDVPDAAIELVPVDAYGLD